MTDSRLAAAPTVAFLSAETLLNALDGYGVAAESPAGPMEGILHRFKPELQPEGVYMASFHDPITDDLLGATDVRNFTRITVL